jgi:hypothetical protein
MKVGDLIKLLNSVDPNSPVLVRLDGSIFGTDNVDEHIDYNDSPEVEFYILATEDFPDEVA